ncbi:hypothetical protein [Streptomyces roseoverticillatus]|uniref:hypothetical protein n=1 Tax=Streptomyces roseoverticillatus TaxID=66429 RepID=UPI0004C2570F|nr:hypothetical protein [Streptomyces roseoverticillatus]
MPADATALLMTLADRVAGDCLRATEVVRSAGADVPELSGPYPAAESAPLRCAVAQAQTRGPDADLAAVLLNADTEAWLTGVAHDAARVVRTAAR